MDKRIILKYFRGETTPDQRQRIREWLNADIRNREYFARLGDLCLFAKLPVREAEPAEMEIAEQIIRLSPRKKHVSDKYRLIKAIVRYGIAAAIIVLLALNIRFPLKGRIETGKPERELLSDLPRDYIHTIYTTRGVKGEVTLPDGSVVKLNSDSRIVFPDKFTGATREVYLSGEAYFNVVTDPDTPMIVSTNRNFIVKVYGTEFNIRSYPNEHNAKTTLFKGKIDLLTKDKKGDEKVIAVLKPSESFVLRDKERPLLIMKADTLKSGAWRYGTLMFDSTPMDEVIRELERWHGAEFVVRDSSIYKLRLTASFKQESLVQILEIIKFCSKVDYKIDENKVILTLNASHF